MVKQVDNRAGLGSLSLGNHATLVFRSQHLLGAGGKGRLSTRAESLPRDGENRVTGLEDMSWL